MLTQALRALDRDGLVRRTVHLDVPIRVQYALSESGRTRYEPLRALRECSVVQSDAIANAQEAYDLRG